MSKRIYAFGAGAADGDGSMKNLLGGKGANLAEMVRLGIPVPSGFTITTEVCTAYHEGGRKLPAGLMDEVRAALARVEREMDARFGDPERPLLLSVRSGARASMPGMMDTILNLGLNDRVAAGLARLTGNARFAADCYRRFVAMYGDVVLGLKPESEKAVDPFEAILDEAKKARGVERDIELAAEDLQALVGRFKAAVKQGRGVDFPDDPWAQLEGAIAAVFDSWDNPRARTYRKMYGYPASWGTAVNVQAMVFGNLGEDCATGVAFTRDPSTGEARMYGEFLANAQGEDVVAGVRTPRPMSELDQVAPGAGAELERIRKTLEGHFRDMQDIEFTIQRGKLWMLQTRNGKRTARAMVKIAVDLVGEGLIDQKEAILRQDPAKVDELLHPRIDAGADVKQRVIAKGLPASPGAAIGRVVFTASDAEAMAARGEEVVLVRMETSPEDIHGMKAARGILTSRGGMTCLAPDTLVLTDRGLLPAERAFADFEAGGELSLLSFDCRAMRPTWRRVVAAGKKPGDVIAVSVSQTGRVEENLLRLTADHKLYALERRRLVKRPLAELLAEDGFATVVDQLPPLAETTVSPAFAYVAGAILSDGYIRLTATKGSVTFVQKPTAEKADFIAAVEHAFERAFGVPFSYVRSRETVATLRGREIRGSVQDRICFRRDPAERLMAVRNDLCGWALAADRIALCHFLAGYIDGDGTFAEESSGVRVQISMSGAKRELMEGVVIACLRLGILPQVTPNRDNFTVQLSDNLEPVLAFTQRVRPELPPRSVASRCLSVRGLFDDIVDDVNFMGRVREGLKRNIMFGADKLRRDVLPLCPPEAHRELAALLDAPLRSHRLRQVGVPEATTVYNFEVDATDELEKNFVVFTSRLTPVLVSNSHAAVVARGMGRPCVVGASSLSVDYRAGSFKAGTVTVKEGETITIDGGTGEVILGKVPLVPAKLTEEFAALMAWVDRTRRLGVRTNADTETDARTARAFGAEGIGLCRTEHMFFEPERIIAVRRMILAESAEERRAALATILPMQRGDFAAIFREMRGLPVTIRLLDPPLHEFLPHAEAEIAEVAAALGVSPAAVKARAESHAEQNPMLGHRGCRLAVTHPEIYEMQARAIGEAAAAVAAAGLEVHPEIMIPIVGLESEIARMRALVERAYTAAAAGVPAKIGTMIELPRACVVADKIAAHAEFFSFGTNDLTQTTFGFSRDDIAHFLPAYLEGGLLAVDPFVSLDQEGVGALVRLGVERGRAARAGLKIGICGEHGGDPASIDFCHRVGLDYVSCSPFRVPVARLAAAQAALRAGNQGA